MLATTSVSAYITTHSPTGCTADLYYPWTTCSNAFANGGSYSYSNNFPMGVWDTYNFLLPDSSTISKVRVRTDALSVGGSNPNAVQLVVNVSLDDGSMWGPEHRVNLTSSETSRFFDVTNDFALWTPEDLDHLVVYAACYTNNGGTASECRLDWLPVEVTYI
ncbi:hypothetical protein HZB00_00480 [Candidatus Woesearchaeota archaeon]|nr:hypothetical protein [Candidatus Woesearchaeota archaeon]